MGPGPKSWDSPISAGNCGPVSSDVHMLVRRVCILYGLMFYIYMWEIITDARAIVVIGSLCPISVEESHHIWTFIPSLRLSICRATSGVGGRGTYTCPHMDVWTYGRNEHLYLMRWEGFGPLPWGRSPKMRKRWSGMVWSGLVRSGLVRSGQVRSV
jgi:hypothetical protein